MNAVTTTQREFTVVRLLEAPRELVFQAWTDPSQLDQWFANPGTTASSVMPTTVDLRVGGTWRLLMVENEEKSYLTGGIYREIVAPEKLAFAWGAVGGWPALDADRLDEAPVVTIFLNDVDGGTEMVLHVRLADHLTETEVRDWFALGIRQGWDMTLDRLSGRLAAMGG